MSIRYRDNNGAETVVSGMTPGGNLETGAVATREGTFVIPAKSSAAATQIQVTFSEPMMDADYVVELTQDQSAATSMEVYSKTASGFRVNTFATQAQSALTCQYKAFKLYEVADAEQLYSEVTDIEAMVPSNASSTNKFATINDLTGETRSLDRRLDDVEDVIPNDATIANKLATAEDVAEAMANAGLKVTDTIPASPQDGDVLLYIGTEEGFTKGGIYQYSATQDEWILISTADVDLSHYETSWTGTKAEWDALTSAEKKKYQLANITDDVIGGEVADEVTDGLMSPVTSNAVYDSIWRNKYRIQSLSTGGSEGACVFTHIPNGSCNFLIGNFRTGGQNTNDGFGIIKVYGDAAYLVCKTGLEGVRSVTYDRATETVTVQSTGYMNYIMILQSVTAE